MKMIVSEMTELYAEESGDGDQWLWDGSMGHSHSSRGQIRCL